MRISYLILFQSSFELTGYITVFVNALADTKILFQSSFELTGYITEQNISISREVYSFKALSSLQVI